MSFLKEMFFLLVLATFCIPGSIELDPESEIRKAYERRTDQERAQLDGLGPNFLESLIEVVQCINNKIPRTGPCYYDASINPHEYVKECLNGTGLENIIKTLYDTIPTIGLSFGIPPQVSKDRCFKLSPLLTTSTLPTSLPVSVTNPPVSVTTPRLLDVSPDLLRFKPTGS